MDPFTIVLVGSYSTDYQLLEWCQDEDFRNTKVIYFRFKSWMQESDSFYDLLKWGQYLCNLPEEARLILGTPSGLEWATLRHIKKLQNEVPDFIKKECHLPKLTIIECDPELFSITQTLDNRIKIQWDNNESQLFYKTLVQIIDTRKKARISNVPGLQGMKFVTDTFKKPIMAGSKAPFLLHGLGFSGAWCYDMFSKTKKVYFVEEVTQGRTNLLRNGRNDHIADDLDSHKNELWLGKDVYYTMLTNIHGNTRNYLQSLKSSLGYLEPDEEIVVAWVLDNLSGGYKPILLVGVSTIGLEPERAFPVDTDFYQYKALDPNRLINQEDCYSQTELGSVWHPFQDTSILMATTLKKKELEFYEHSKFYTGNANKSVKDMIDRALDKNGALPMHWPTYFKSIYSQNVRLPRKDVYDLSMKSYENGLKFLGKPQDVITFCCNKAKPVFSTIIKYIPKLLRNLSENSPLEAPFDLKQIFFHSTREALNGSNGSLVSNKNLDKASSHGMMDIARPIFLVENSDLEDSHFKALQSVLSVILNMCETTIKKSGDNTSVQNIDGWITAMQEFPLPLFNFTSTSESSFSQDNFSRKALKEDLWSILDIGPLPSSDLISTSISDTLFTKLKSYGEQLKAISKTDKSFKILAVVGIGSTQKSVLKLVVGELLPKETDFALLCADEKTNIHFNYSRYDFELNIELITKVYERIQDNITKAIADQLLDYINNHFAV